MKDLYKPYHLSFPLQKMTKEEANIINKTLSFFSESENWSNILKNIQDKILLNYKIDFNINFSSYSIPGSRDIINLLSIQDIIIHVYNNKTCQDSFIILDSMLVRLLLCELLATSRFDGFDGCPLSSTEKGLLLFIACRFLLDLSFDLNLEMPVKIINIYNKEDDFIKKYILQNYLSINLYLFFAQKKFNLVILTKKESLVLNKILPNKKIESIWHDIFHDLKVIIKILNISLKELLSISIGDLIIIERNGLYKINQHLMGPVFFIWSGIKGRAELLCINDTYKIKVDEFNMNDEEKIFEENITALSDLPVKLHLELSSISMCLKDICHLGQGSIINLDTPLDAPIKLIIENKLFGHGELIDMEGSLGLRITDICIKDSKIS